MMNYIAQDSGFLGREEGKGSRYKASPMKSKNFLCDLLVE